jgi:Ca2+-transporting ATPase
MSTSPKAQTLPLAHVWHTRTSDQVIADLSSNRLGLSEADSRSRRELYGPNEFSTALRFTVWKIFFRQFTDFMVLVLLAAVGISIWAGAVEDAIAIAAVVILNACIGFFQEYKADKALKALKKMSAPRCTVLRSGTPSGLLSSELVPGDVVLLEAGDRVPADLRLLEVQGMRADESALTGESVSVEKQTAIIQAQSALLGERTNMAFMDTLIVSGHGTGVVVSTGMQTELGKIASLLKGKLGLTPLQKRLQQFGRQVTLLILIICILIFVNGWLNGHALMDVLLLSISLGVAAIPEALPALITLALSLGAARLVMRKVLVRQLSAVETLGSVTCICADKTGTLTTNKMKVRRAVASPAAFTDLRDVIEITLAEAMALNLDVKRLSDGTLSGDPMEVALYESALEQLGQEGFQTCVRNAPRQSEIPFDPVSRCMTTVHRIQEVQVSIVKGAPEAIAPMLTNPDESTWLIETSNGMSAEGLRVLAYALSVKENTTGQIIPGKVIGICGLQDPPRPGVREAVQLCRRAGIRPVMITGDHPLTASAIAREIGIMDNDGVLVEGKELVELGVTEIQRKLKSVSVFARVDPVQKLQIVNLLKDSGETVAMTGDGVNDAPALRNADIGIAMGKGGTDVSRQAAHLVVLDDDFTTIVSAVHEGRRIVDNIRKFVRYTFTCNSAEILIITCAPLLGLPIPLLPVQILYINLVTDGLPGIALAGEDHEHDSMHRPPRKKDESIFAGGVGLHILWVGITMAALVFLLEAHCLNMNSSHMSTIVFTALCFLQFAHVIAVKNERRNLYQAGLGRNKSLFLIVFFSSIIQLLVLYSEWTRNLLHLHKLTFAELGLSVLPAVLLFHAVEVEKVVRRRFSKRTESV